MRESELLGKHLSPTTWRGGDLLQWLQSVYTNSRIADKCNVGSVYQSSVHSSTTRKNNVLFKFMLKAWIKTTPPAPEHKRTVTLIRYWNRCKLKENIAGCKNLQAAHDKDIAFKSVRASSLLYSNLGSVENEKTFMITFTTYVCVWEIVLVLY